MPPEGTSPAMQRPASAGQRVARHTVMSMVALVVLGGTRVAYGAIVSRVTSHETFGAIGVLIALSMIASYVLPAGIGSATSRFVPFSLGSGDPALARGFFALLSRAADLAAPILGVGTALVARFVIGSSTAESLFAGLLAATYSLYTTEKASLYAFGRVSTYMRLEIVTSTLTLGLAVVVAIGRAWYLLPFVVGYAAFAIAARLSLRSSAAGSASAPSRADRREVAGYVGLACLGTVASAGFLQGTQLLATRFVAPAEVAYFTAAVTLITPLYFLPRALALALFPSMAEAHGGGRVDVIRRHADVSTRGLLAVLAPLIVVAELLAPQVLSVFGGASYARGAIILQVMLAAAFVGVIQVASVNALSSGPGWQLRTPVGWSVAGFVTGLIVTALVGGPLGGLGVAIGYLVGTAVTAGGPVIVVWRRYELPWARPFLRAFGPVVAALVVARLIDPVTPDPLASGLVRIAIAAAGAALSVLVLRPELVALAGTIRLRREADGPQLSPIA